MRSIRLLVLKGTKRHGVAMHDAVEKDVAVGAEKCAYERNTRRDADGPLPNSQGKLTTRSSRKRTRKPNERGPNKRVKEPVNRILASEEVECRFKVGDDLRVTEDCETEMRRRRGFECGSGAEMERCEWHFGFCHDPVHPSSSGQG
jgi:hypothetical protein